jgi:hypothetical protein
VSPLPSTRADVLLFPVRPCDACPRAAASTFWFARRSDGTRVVLAFSDASALRAACGPDVVWEAMALPAAHALLDPLGVDEVCVDPEQVLRRRVTDHTAA